MSNDICELLRTRKAKEIHCNEIECIIKFDDCEKVMQHNDFIKCFYSNVVQHDRNNNLKQYNHNYNYVKIKKGDMTTHQRNVYDKKGKSHVRINRDHMTAHQRDVYENKS